MAKKEYASLVSQEKYVYEKEKDSFFRESIRRISDTYHKYISAIYCPKCGHLHIVDGRRYHNGRYLRKFLCPKCGYQNEVQQDGAWLTPETAMIFKMADGSIAVSLIIRKHTLLVAKDLKTPIYHGKLMRIRYVFNTNGHTYYKAPVYIDSGRPVPMYSKTINIRPVTYMHNDIIWSKHAMFPHFNEEMMELVERGYIPEDYVRKNRFHNLGNKMLDDIYTLLSMFHRQHSGFGKRIASIVREIDKNATDEDVIRLFIKRANIKNAGKKFRRSMATDIVKTFVGSVIFNKLQMTDINYFDIVKHVNPSFLEDERFIELANIIQKKYGEKALAKALQTSPSMFIDVINYMARLSVAVPITELENAIRYNIRDTHDVLLNMFREVQNQIECGTGIASVMQKHNDIESGKIKPQYISAAKTQVIHHAEETINNQIMYGEQEKALEENIGDIQFYLPPDTNHLKMAGDKLHNCVGHLYRMAAYRKKSIIVLMRQMDKFVGCIEINNGKIKQAYGPCNQRFTTDAQKAFNQWTEKHNLSTTTANTGLVNIGKEYVMPKYEDVIEKIKVLVASITIPASSQQINVNLNMPLQMRRNLPF